MKKIRMPEENVEYTFRFPPKKMIVYRWFGDVTEQGRLLLWNKTGKYYTGMTAVYFSFLCRNRLVNRQTVEPISDKPDKKTPAVKNSKALNNVTYSPPEEKKYTVLTEQEQAENVIYCNKIIEELKGYSDVEKHFLKIKVGQRVDKEKISLYDVGRMINNVEQLKGEISDDEYSAVMGRYLTISNIVRDYRAQCGGLR